MTFPPVLKFFFSLFYLLFDHISNSVFLTAGDFPSIRCGSGMTMYKNKALLFGGVFDDEGEWIV